ncbi:MAG: hypothetical protein ACTTJC_03150 [Campylobacter sp.]
MSDIASDFPSKDSFELELENKKKILQDCQTNKGLKSCFNCDELFECQTRKFYVDAVYNSMSKGSSGGFDF